MPPTSMFPMERATSMAHTFKNGATTANSIALEAAGMRGEDTYPDSDDDFFVDENGRPFAGSSSTMATPRKGKDPSTQHGMAVNIRPKVTRR
ncbi:hypothetical protein PSPO01_04858 [Paraphaeosphaeria sporulosa]